MRMDTFIRKALGLKAHRVVTIEEDEAAGVLVVHLDRRERRRLHCGTCGRAAGRVAPARRWRDLALREHVVELVYAPCRVWCIRCGLRVERIPWAEPWQRVIAILGLPPCRALTRGASPEAAGHETWEDRTLTRVTRALARAVARLARELNWSAVAQHFRLNWKTIATVVEGAVLWGLQHRRWAALHVIGIDEVSRRKGQQYLTIVYDLARGRVIWVGRDRNAATMERFFAWLGPRRKVDFDMALLVIASGLYRLLARTMRGYADAQARQIFRDLIDMPATVEITTAGVLVQFHRRAHLPIVIASGLLNKPVNVPWWNGLPLRLAA
jgi:transposase